MKYLKYMGLEILKKLKCPFQLLKLYEFANNNLYSKVITLMTVK